MEHETDLLTFLHEVADLRITALCVQADQLPEFIKVKQATLDFMESVTDEKMQVVLFAYEDLKLEYISLIIHHLYIAGAKDSLALYGLLSKQTLSQN